MKRKGKIKERLAQLQKSLSNAEKYLEKGENIEGLSWFHFDDWRGNSGHPDWVRNKMIPATKRMIIKAEKQLENIEKKIKDRNGHQELKIL